MKLIAFVLTAALSQTAPTLRPGATTTGDVALAVASIPRFTPDRFAALPPSVREAFTAINCQVPQNSLSAGPANVIDGEFAQKGQQDWAALCSNGSITEIRIVWGGPPRCEDRLGARQDSDTITANMGRFVYSRSISTGSRGALDVIEDTVNGARLAHACINGHWQPAR